VNNNYPEEKSNYKKLIIIYRILVLFSIFESLIAFSILSKNSIPKISLEFGHSAERLNSSPSFLRVFTCRIIQKANSVHPDKSKNITNRR